MKFDAAKLNQHQNRETRVLLLAASKGGVGKTTLAVNLAGVAAQRGYNVFLADMDGQFSTKHSWLAERAKSAAQPAPIQSVTVSAGRIDVALRELPDTADLLIIDTPPVQSVAIEAMAAAADLVFVPCGTLKDERRAISPTLKMLKTLQTPSYVVINSVRPQSAKAHEVVEIIENQDGEYDFDVADIMVGKRAVFEHAADVGLSVSEYDANCVAAEEINQLADWTFEKMNLQPVRIAEMAE